MSADLHTLIHNHDHQVEIRKSRFMARAAPVGNVEAAMAFIETCRGTPASHHCWAFRVGQNYRFHDDGEPGGSAGKPILAAIDGQGLDRTAVVVTRWFGGIKLGVGGLVRAYGGTAAECLRMADKAPIIACLTLALSCDYAALPLLKSRLPGLEVSVLEEHFSATTVELRLEVPEHRHDELASLVRDVSRGQSQLQTVDHSPSAEG